MRGATIAALGETITYQHFNSHAPCGARRLREITFFRSIHFNSHAPCGARQRCTPTPKTLVHFNSHAPCGARPTTAHFWSVHGIFQLTRPMRGATNGQTGATNSKQFQLTRPMRGATNRIRRMPCAVQFQLTRPMRGATMDAIAIMMDRYDFNSHAPCGARRWVFIGKCGDGEISTHTPHAGRDGTAGNGR